MKHVITTPERLTEKERISFGAFYTPLEIVDKVIELIVPFSRDKAVVLDPAGGYGAFIEKLKDWDYRVADIDVFAVEYLRKHFDPQRVFLTDALKNVNRDKYKIAENDFLIVVGNPPYNDQTSLYKKGQKGSFEMDPDVFDKDLGISFIKAMDKLRADVICFLHPMSYLIKKTNFSRLKKFFSHYRLERAIVFPNFVFKHTSRNSGFPILIALYVRNYKGFSWDELQEFTFEFLTCSEVFRLKEIETTDSFINKYPRKGLSPIGLYFHTFRDINSLLRNRDFLTEATENTIPLDVENFSDYAYLVSMKYYILERGSRNFWFYGNFSPLVEKDFFTKNKQVFACYALEKTKNIPEKVKQSLRKNFKCLDSVRVVEDYFGRLFRYAKKC